MRRKDIVFFVTLLLVLIPGFVMTLGYPPRARLFPLIVISLCGILVLVELAKTLSVSLRSRSAEISSQEDGETSQTNKEYREKFAVMVAWTGGFLLMIWLFGFVVGLPLFVLVYVKAYEKGWRWAIMLTATMFVIVYVFFGLLLQTPLYEGRLFL